MGRKAKNAVSSVETTFEVLDTLMELDGGGVTELASHLELPKSTLHNYLSTLEQEEFVVKEGSDYRIGVRFLELGAFARNQYLLYEIARPEVDRLAEETGELANLLVEEHGWGIYLDRAQGDEAVAVEAHIGTRVHLHSTALGKAILSHIPERRVEGIVEQRGLPAVTEKTTTDLDELKTELETIREQGYAVDDEEHHEGLRCIAAPITSNSGRALGAMSVAGPMNRMRGDRFTEEIPQLLKERVNVVELNVTYS